MDDVDRADESDGAAVLIRNLKFQILKQIVLLCFRGVFWVMSIWG